MKRAMMLILALLLTMKVVTAQDDFPPDPSEIFTDAVEIVSIQVEPLPPPSCLTFDNETRTVRIYDETNEIWNDFEYPDDIAQIIWCSYIRSDGLMLIAIDTDSDTYTAEEFWLVNPDTGEFTRAETVCDDQVRVASGEGQWRFYTNPDDGRDYICFTETGELRGPLPAGLHWFLEYGDYGSRNIPSLSPNGEWLAFIGYGLDERELLSQAEVYSFNLRTEVLNHQGSLDIRPRFYDETGLGILSWVSDVLGTAVDFGQRDYLPSRYYSFDASQPESLQPIFSGWAIYSQNPRRYQYLQSDWVYDHETGTDYGHLECILHIYDAQGARSYELGYDCQMHSLNDLYETCLGGYQYGNDYYYLRFDANPSAISNVMHLNVQTGETVELIHGEIEELLSVSPDGRYLALVADNNGQIDRVDTGCNWLNWDALSGAKLLIYDTVDEYFVYQTLEFGGRGAVIHWLETGGFLLGLDSRWAPFVFNEEDLLYLHTDSTLNLVTEANVRSFNGVNYNIEIVAHSPDDLQFITSHGQFIDFVTMSRTVFLTEETINDRSVPPQYEWHEDGTIDVTFDYFARGVVTYTVHIIPQESP